MSSNTTNSKQTSKRQRSQNVVSNTFDHIEWQWYDEVLQTNYSLPDGQMKQLDPDELESYEHPDVIPARHVPMHINDQLMPMTVAHNFRTLSKPPTEFIFNFKPTFQHTSTEHWTQSTAIAMTSDRLRSLKSHSPQLQTAAAARQQFITHLLHLNTESAQDHSEELLCESLLQPLLPRPNVPADEQLFNHPAFKNNSEFDSSFYSKVAEVLQPSHPHHTHHAHGKLFTKPLSLGMSDSFGFVVTCEHLTFDIGPVEPLFGCAALYDVGKKERLSETFYFDFNGENMAQLYNFENNTIRAADKSALFSVRAPSPEIVLVVRIERLLRGDVENDITAYACKAKDMSAARNTFAQETRKLAAKGGSRLQPLAWAATELFGKRGWLGGRRVTMDLMAASDNQCSDAWVLDKGLRGAAKRIAVGRLSVALRRVAPFIDESTADEENDDHKKLSIPQEERLPTMLMRGPGDEEWVLESTSHGSLRKSLSEFKTPPSFTCREVLSLQPASLAVRRVHDYLYVYCESVVVKQEANVMAEVSLAVGDTTVERVFCQRNGSTSQFGCTSVVYRSKQPSWYDELKIRLPAYITSAHVLRFTFFHVVPAKKQKEKSSWIAGKQASKERVVLGTAQLPLLTLVGAPKVVVQPTPSPGEASADDDDDEVNSTPSSNSNSDRLPNPLTAKTESPTITPRPSLPQISRQNSDSDVSEARRPSSSDRQGRSNSPRDTVEKLSERVVAGLSGARVGSKTRKDRSSSVDPKTRPRSKDEDKPPAAVVTLRDFLNVSPPRSITEKQKQRRGSVDDGIIPDVRQAAKSDAQRSQPGGREMCRFVADGLHVLPVTAVRWMDNKRNVFVVRTQLVSSVRSQDEALLAFWHTLAPSTHALRTSVTALFQARTSSLFQFFPLIGEQLMGLACQVDRAVAINALHALHTILNRMNAASALSTRDAADHFAKRVFAHREVPVIESELDILLVVPSDAHYSLLRHWLHFRHKRRAPKNERRGESNDYPYFDDLCIDVLLRSMALLHSKEKASAQDTSSNTVPPRAASHQQPMSFAGSSSPLDDRRATNSTNTPNREESNDRLGLRRFVPQAYVDDLFILLNELVIDAPASPRPQHTLRLVISVFGRLAALLMPSQWFALLHRVIRATTSTISGAGLNFAIDLLAALHASRFVTPLDAPAAPLNAVKPAASAARAVAAKVAGHSSAAAALVALEQCAASVHGVTALLVALVRHVLCAPKVSAMTRQHALLALRDVMIAIELNDPLPLGAATTATPRTLSNVGARAPASVYLFGALVPLLGATCRLHSQGVFDDLRIEERYELMLACVAVLRSMPCEVLCDQWLLASDPAARRAFYSLLQAFAVMALAANRGVRSETLLVCTRAMCVIIARLGAANSAEQIDDKSLADTIDAALSLAATVLHVPASRRLIAALVCAICQAPGASKVLFEARAGAVASCEALCALLLHMCAGGAVSSHVIETIKESRKLEEEEKLAAAAESSSNDTDTPVPTASQNDVGASLRQLGRTLLVVALRADKSGADGVMASSLARCCAWAVARGANGHALAAALGAVAAGGDGGKHGLTLTPALRVVSAPQTMELSTAARARRRHRVPELVLQAAVDSVRQDPRQALAWFDTLARVHAADSSRVEERGHALLLAAALVAGRLQRRNSLEPLLAQLLLRALSLIAPPARRLYALSVVGDDLTDVKDDASRSPNELLRLLTDAAECFQLAGAIHTCIELCHVLAHAHLAAGHLNQLAKIHTMAADVTRELVTRRGRALRTSLLFLVRFRSASSPPEDYIYSQSLAGLASTAQLVHRLHAQLNVEAEANGDSSPVFVDELPSTPSDDLVVCIEQAYMRDDSARRPSTGAYVIRDGEMIELKMERALPGPLARVRVHYAGDDAPPSDQTCLFGDVSLPDINAHLNANDEYEQHDDDNDALASVDESERLAMLWFARQRNLNTIQTAFDILRNRVTKALETAHLNA